MIPFPSMSVEHPIHGSIPQPLRPTKSLSYRAKISLNVPRNVPRAPGRSALPLKAVRERCAATVVRDLGVGALAPIRLSAVRVSDHRPQAVSCVLQSQNSGINPICYADLRTSCPARLRIRISATSE